MRPRCCPACVPHPPHGSEDPRRCSAFSAGLIPFGLSSDTTTRKASALLCSDVPGGGRRPVSEHGWVLVSLRCPQTLRLSRAASCGYLCPGPRVLHRAPRPCAQRVRFCSRMPMGRKVWPAVGSVVFGLFHLQRTETGDMGKGCRFKS